MRSFFIGLVLLVAFSATALGLRPGGLRRQLRFAARRFRIALGLGGVYVVASTAIRLLFTSGPISDFGPPLIAAILIVAYLFLARDPAPAGGSPPPSRAR